MVKVKIKDGWWVWLAVCLLIVFVVTRREMFSKKIKKLDVFDWVLAAFASVAFAYFIITVPNPTNNVIMRWVHSVHWGWFLAAGLILAARPKIKTWFT